MTAQGAASLGAPLRVPLFRRIWFASMLSNMGLLIQGVGAAWAMIRLSDDPAMVALVQTALFIPVMLLSLAAGAIADMFDRRKVALVALSICLASAGLLCGIAFSGLLTPWLLLGLCFGIGCGMALFGPTWQASVSEQVPTPLLSQAIALNSISFNVARSFGPAVGGVIVATAGAASAFLLNALFYIPLFIVLLFWHREPSPSRLPPERLGRAMTSGARFIIHSPPIRAVLLRTLATAVAGGSLYTLMPLVAKDLLGGSAQTLGFILGAFGIGAITSALMVGRLRARMPAETLMLVAVMLLAGAIMAVALSDRPWLTATALLGAGWGWSTALTLFIINIQLAAPRWVTGRTMAASQAASAGGLALAGWAWGQAAAAFGVSAALLLSAGMLLLTMLLRIGFALPEVEARDMESVPLDDFDVALDLTGRSGPIAIEIEYQVDPDQARPFYQAMQDVEQLRHRNGAYDWSLARDIADPGIWTEHFHCPTWHDYLRQRDRNTSEELRTIARAVAFHAPGGEPVVRRRLVRPFGSVRWREESRDEGMKDAVPISAGLG